MALDVHWAKLCEVMGRSDLASAPGFATNAERVVNRDAVNQAVGAWCAAHARVDVDRRLGDAGVAAAKVDTYEDAAHNPHVLERDMLQEAVLEDGTVAPLPARPSSSAGPRPACATPRRAVGADNADILAELGLDEDEIAELRADGVL